MQTLLEAKNNYQKLIESTIKQGNKSLVICPCCENGVRIYKRSISNAMAVDLIKFYKHNGTNFAHIQYITRVGGGGDFAKLRYWGLIKAPSKDFVDKNSKGGKTSGYWKLTNNGVGYVQGTFSVVEYLLMIEGKIVGYDGGMVTIRDSINKKFNYDELMSLI